MKKALLVVIVLALAACAKPKPQGWRFDPVLGKQKCAPWTYGCSWMDADNCNVCSCAGEGLSGEPCRVEGCTLVYCGWRLVPDDPK